MQPNDNIHLEIFENDWLAGLELSFKTAVQNEDWAAVDGLTIILGNLNYTNDDLEALLG